MRPRPLPDPRELPPGIPALLLPPDCGSPPPAWPRLRWPLRLSPRPLTSGVWALFLRAGNPAGWPFTPGAAGTPGPLCSPHPGGAAGPPHPMEWGSLCPHLRPAVRVPVCPSRAPSSPGGWGGPCQAWGAGAVSPFLSLPTPGRLRGRGPFGALELLLFMWKAIGTFLLSF